jgi:transglutaminase-like putative cysteine protease
VRLEIVHTTRIEYSTDVVEGVMDTRLGPLSDPHQRWEHFDLEVQPLAAIRPYADGFGNPAHLITVSRPHRGLEIVARSEVFTLLDNPFNPPSVPPRPLSPSERWDYLSASRLVERCEAVAALAEPLQPPEPAAAFESVRALMALIYTNFRYEQYQTSVATTVAEVARDRRGVCQDFAHLLIGLCRAIAIPARYVSGYLALSEPGRARSQASTSPSQLLEVGSGRGAAASHAWVEAFTPTHGWRGFDPTNNVLASEHHVKMAIGRDYSDVPPTRGTARGGSEERLTVEVATRVLD